MTKRLSIVALFLAMAVTFSSCGVMFGGSRYEAKIVAKDRPNADIYVNGEKIGRGTATGIYHRNQPLKVELKEDGCETTAKTYDKSFRTGNFILSVISWGLLGIIVDLATGASYKPDHRHDPSIKKVSDKTYQFEVASPCTKK
ncbi:PEGA domain-containing protein [Flavobacterium longum]|uniref:hypothetical protein n=1 Tax=Flavobacterium longum TaxID=1299340 RepID=UPI0039E8F6BF